MPKRTPLYEEHLKAGGKMVDFAGFEMPVQYKEGVLSEHLAVRKAGGLFDVSHMGEFEFIGPDALACLQWLTVNNVAKLTDGMAQYSILLHESGGVVDDILVYREKADRFIMVVNASNIAKDWAWVGKNKKGNVTLRNLSDTLSLIAFQGPKAVEIVQTLTDTPVQQLKSFRFAAGLLAGQKNCWIARTGYTGEDGVEIFCQNAQATPIWQALLAAGASQGVVPVGLGARDTLRLEARLSLYGHEINDETNPFEAGLSWVVKMDKEDFLGKKSLTAIQQKGLTRQIVGFKMIDKGIARQGYPISNGTQTVGQVTSGSHSPTLGIPIGLGYVPTSMSAVGTQFYIDIRKSLKLAEVVATPFYKR